jgi:signal transduction histidine kinase
MNLFSNAAKYTNDGAIRINASLFNINVIKISVIDTGCGIFELN